jgi:hypothetical protein
MRKAVFIFKSFWLETFSLPDSTTGAPAILAFLVVLRVLIKLFFSMLMMGSPLKILSDNFLLLSTHMCKAWEGPNSGLRLPPGPWLKIKPLAWTALATRMLDGVKFHQRLKINDLWLIFNLIAKGG